MTMTPDEMAASLRSFSRAVGELELALTHMRGPEWTDGWELFEQLIADLRGNADAYDHLADTLLRLPAGDTEGIEDAEQLSRETARNAGFITTAAAKLETLIEEAHLRVAAARGIPDGLAEGMADDAEQILRDLAARMKGINHG